jgi:hypothetical protein
MDTSVSSSNFLPEIAQEARWFQSVATGSIEKPSQRNVMIKLKTSKWTPVESSI